MATNQENILSAIETETGLSGLSYNQALMELAEYYGISTTNVNSMFAQYLKMSGDSTKTNINDLLANYASLNFDGNVNAINDITTFTEGGNFDFQDGDNFFFQNDTNFKFN